MMRMAEFDESERRMSSGGRDTAGQWTWESRPTGEEERIMNENQKGYMLTGAGLALGAALGLLLWTMTGSILYMAIGTTLGLVIGAAGDGYAHDRR
jgi:hypothetical protein